MTEIFDDKGNSIEAYDEDGNPIDVFNENEVSEKVKEKEEEVKTELEEKLEETKVEYEGKVAKKDEEIEKIKTDIEAGVGGDKGKNLSALRKKLEESEKNKAEIDSKFETFKKETDQKIAGIHQTVSEGKLTEAIKEVVGNNKELLDKVKFHFNQFVPDSETDPVKREANFKERIKNASILATGGKATGIVGDVAGTKGGYVPSPNGEATHETPEGEVKSVGLEKMGLTEKDFRDHKKAKYGQ